MNAYDFDKTIYHVDSTADFYLWSMRRCPRALLSIPRTLFAFTLMGLHLRSKTRCKEMFYSFLRYLPEGMEYEFWHCHMQGIYKWYLDVRRPDDVVISASPEFLLKPVAEALGFALIATPVDSRRGTSYGPNCHGAEKLRRFREQYGDTSIEAFYSDSLSDAPMAAAAKQAFMIRRGRPVPWPQKK